MSIKIKFIIFNTFLTVLLAFGLGVLSVISIRNLLMKEAEKRVMGLAHALAQAAAGENSLKDESSILAAIQDMMKQEDILMVSVSDAQGVIIAHSDIRKVEKATHISLDERIRYDRQNDPPHIEISVPIRTAGAKEEEFLFGGDQAGGAGDGSREIIGYAQIEINLSKVDQIVKKMTFTILAIIAGAILVAMILVFRVLDALLSPLHALKRGVEAFGLGNLGFRVRAVSNDEIADLSRSFNRMADKLQATLDDLKASKETTEELNRNLEEKVKERTRELEQAHSRMIQSEKMSAVGQLAAGVAHEFNNPLGIMLGYAQALYQKVKPG